VKLYRNSATTFCRSLFNIHCCNYRSLLC